MQKQSNLLTRRRNSILLATQSTNFSTEPNPIDPASIHVLNVKIPPKSYTGLGYLLYKLRYLLWRDVMPQNTLNQSFFISLDSLTVLRQIMMSLYASCLTWQSMKIFHNIESNLSTETSWLSFWGLLLGTLYFLLTLVSQDNSDSDFLWKFTYMIGEIGISIEILILLLYAPFVVLSFANETFISFDNIAYNICITILCPLFAIVETVYNHIAFPKCHRISLCVIAGIYLLSELAWMIIKNSSLTEIVDSTDAQSYLLKGAAMAMMLVEFTLGKKFFDWKEKSASKPSKGTD